MPKTACSKQLNQSDFSKNCLPDDSDTIHTDSTLDNNFLQNKNSEPTYRNYILDNTNLNLRGNSFHKNICPNFLNPAEE